MEGKRDVRTLSSVLGKMSIVSETFTLSFILLSLFIKIRILPLTINSTSNALNINQLKMTVGSIEHAFQT